MSIRLLPHDQNWRLTFRREQRHLVQILASNLVILEHIGSTAISDVVAQPVIDMLAVVKDLNRVDLSSAAIASLGYRGMGENGIADRRVFLRESPEGAGQYAIFVHAFGSMHVPAYVAFREYLNAHPAVAQRFNTLKLALVAEHPDDAAQYLAGKETFFQRHDAEARAWFAQQR